MREAEVATGAGVAVGRAAAVGGDAVRDGDSSVVGLAAEAQAATRRATTRGLATDEGWARMFSNLE